MGRDTGLTTGAADENRSTVIICVVLQKLVRAERIVYERKFVNFSLRTLCRALRQAASNTYGSVLRSLYEVCTFFLHGGWTLSAVNSGLILHNCRIAGILPQFPDGAGQDVAPGRPETDRRAGRRTEERESLDQPSTSSTV